MPTTSPRPSSAPHPAPTASLPPPSCATTPSGRGTSRRRSASLPPHNTHAKLGPADPDGVAAHLSGLLTEAAGGAVEFVVIDANDLTATVLGASPGADRVLAATLMRDNPLGQGHEQTPVCVLRPLGPLPSQS